MKPIHTRLLVKLKHAVLASTISLASVQAAPVDWVLLVEPSFMDYEIRRSISGSERTVLAVARLADDTINPLTRDEKRGIPVTYAQIEESARKTASSRLANLTPTFVRNQRGVIEYALLESDDPLTASTVLAPDFSETFSKTLGPDLLVAIPNRFQVFVFSRQDQAYQKMGEAIISSYLSATYPVSREIFSLENGRLRSLGVLQ